MYLHTFAHFFAAPPCAFRSSQDLSLPGLLWLPLSSRAPSLRTSLLRGRPSLKDLADPSSSFLPSSAPPSSAPGSAVMATAPVASVKGLAEFEYPVPLFVHNTFIEAHAGRPASLDGFYHERQVFSCPGSRISEPPSSDCEPPLAGPRRSVYRPGQQLVQSAAFGGSAGQLFLSVPLGGGEGAGAGEERKVSGSNGFGRSLGLHMIESSSNFLLAEDFRIVARATPFQDVLTFIFVAAEEPSSRLSKWFHSFARVPSEASAPRLADVPVLCLDQADLWHSAYCAGGCEHSMKTVVSRKRFEQSQSVAALRTEIELQVNSHLSPCVRAQKRLRCFKLQFRFCHLCPKGEKQRRQKASFQQFSGGLLYLWLNRGMTFGVKDKRAFFGSIRQFAAPLYAQQEACLSSDRERDHDGFLLWLRMRRVSCTLYRAFQGNSLVLQLILRSERLGGAACTPKCFITGCGTASLASDRFPLLRSIRSWTPLVASGEADPQIARRKGERASDKRTHRRTGARVRVAVETLFVFMPWSCALRNTPHLAARSLRFERSPWRRKAFEAPAMPRSANGEALVYPLPLVVRNTFIDCPQDRPASFDEFFFERKDVIGFPGLSDEELGQLASQQKALNQTLAGEDKKEAQLEDNVADSFSGLRDKLRDKLAVQNQILFHSLDGQFHKMDDFEEEVDSALKAQNQTIADGLKGQQSAASTFEAQVSSEIKAQDDLIETGSSSAPVYRAVGLASQYEIETGKEQRD
ncbi:unnamed protein product [Polarella glacialis]|uniref:Uncharacterized protein n=1 Tax=Polarella glacialis TaxID=89957 RepID=A0A813EZ21_POLGL|nr:unnamed protein product [Polarella glacialis]